MRLAHRDVKAGFEIFNLLFFGPIDEICAEVKKTRAYATHFTVSNVVLIISAVI